MVGPAAENCDAVRDIVAGLAEQKPVVHAATADTATADTPRVGSWDDASAVLASVRKSGQVRVRVVTWNMQAKAPPPIEVLRKELLPAEKVKEANPNSFTPCFILFKLPPSPSPPAVSCLCHRKRRV